MDVLIGQNECNCTISGAVTTSVWRIQVRPHSYLLICKYSNYLYIWLVLIRRTLVWAMNALGSYVRRAKRCTLCFYKYEVNCQVANRCLVRLTEILCTHLNASKIIGLKCIYCIIIVLMLLRIPWTRNPNDKSGWTRWTCSKTQNWLADRCSDDKYD